MKPRPLFLRLLMYFIIVMLIPLVLVSVFYWGLGQKDVIRNLKREATVYINQDAQIFKSVVESYRHKAYLLSTNESVAEVTRNSSSTDAKAEVYRELYSIMLGDTNLATGSVVSINGRSRFSTHVFPSQYDLRYNTSEASAFSDLSSITGMSSLMTLKWRYQTETNETVVLNIMRRIISSSGNSLGFAVVDVFLDAFNSISDNGLFSDIVVIDKSSFYASSLVMADKHGDLSNFKAVDLSKVGEAYQASDGSIVVIKAISDTNFFLAGMVDTKPYLSGFNSTLYIMLLFLALGVLIAILAALFFSRSISTPVRSLSQNMAEAEHGKLDVQASGSKIAEINQLDKSFNAMIIQIGQLMKLNREEEEKIRQAERKALEAQINPHFLYNTLNTIKSIAKLHGESEILTIVVQLGKLLRSSIDNMNELSTLGESFKMVDSYLKIQKIRFSDRLNVVFDIDESLMEVSTPKLIIQPFIENAIVHGLEPKIGDWLLKVSVKKEDNICNRSENHPKNKENHQKDNQNQQKNNNQQNNEHIRITISDNGVGFDDSIFSDFEALKKSEHNGIYNVYRRLQIHYSDKAKLSIHSTAGVGTETVIILPL